MFVGGILYTTILLASTTPVLEFKDGAFRLSDSQGSRVLMQFSKQPESGATFSLKHNGVWIAWDERGLSWRTTGRNVTSTLFEDAATSQKLQSTDELMLTQREFLNATRKKKASMLAGSALVDDKLYLLVRWEDRFSAPWLEALFVMDLASKDPKPQLLGKLEKFSCASMGRNAAVRIGNEIAVPVADGGGWGIARWNLESNTPSYKELGTGYARCSISADKGRVCFMSQTAYKTTIAGVVDIDGANKRLLAESKGSLGFISERPIVLLEKSARGQVLISAESGAILNVPKDADYFASQSGVLLWAPKTNPNRATLFAGENWTAIANWRPTAARATGTPPPPSRSDKPRKPPGKRGGHLRQ